MYVCIRLEGEQKTFSNVSGINPSTECIYEYVHTFVLSTSYVKIFSVLHQGNLRILD